MINLEYYQVFGSLITGFIAYNLYLNNCLLPEKKYEYLPLQTAIKTLKKIINHHKYYDSIITNQLIDPNFNFNESELAIAIFPLIIYCYQNPHRLEQELEKISDCQLRTIEEVNSIKILSLLVYLILEDRIKFTGITKQLSQELELENAKEIKEIQVIEKLITQRLPLTKVEELISTITQTNLGIYQALYNFLSLPENLEISLQRSRQFSQQKETTIVLTGLLLGLKYGYLGIPYSWRQAIATEGRVKQIETLSKQLVARWQGKLDNRQ